MSGSEIDEWKPPGPETYRLTAPAAEWPKKPLRVALAFDNGVLVSIDGQRGSGHEMLARLNKALGAYGVGRALYTGDTSIGLKGRIVFEAPGLLGLIVAHRALEEAVLTASQNAFKPVAARKWVELVYKGFFYEPLKRDIERFLESSQEFVTGEVTLETSGGAVTAVAVESRRILRAEGAVYAQSADWGAREAEGFIRLLGQSSTLSARINPRSRL
jgi:argininosuccinate synthase